MKSIPLGQYCPADSAIHRLDGRAKITCLLLYFIILFSAYDVWSYAVCFVLSAILILSTKIPLKMYWRSTRILLFFIIFIAIFNLFFTSGEEVIWQWYFLKLTKEGIVNAIYMSLRLTMLLLVCSILTFTSTSMALTDSIESMLSPLKRIRFPAHEMAMMMAIALRFIPTFLEEGDKIVKAQKSRGVDFNARKPGQLARAVIPLVIPLFMSAFRSSEELANAMDARGYRGGEGRTRMHELKLRAADGMVMVCFLFLAAVALLYRFL